MIALFEIKARLPQTLFFNHVVAQAALSSCMPLFSLHVLTDSAAVALLAFIALFCQRLCVKSR